MILARTTSQAPRYSEIRTIITTTTHAVEMVSLRAGQVTFASSAFTSSKKFLVFASTISPHL